MKNKNHGFTLIELMMVLAILTILAGITTYYLHGPGDRFAVKGAARRLYFDLLKAKTRAMEKSSCYAIKFNYPSGYDYSLVEVLCSNPNTVLQTEKQVKLSNDYGQNISKNVTSSSVTYYPNGLCRGCQMSANFTSTRVPYSIVLKVNSLGRVNINE